MNTIKEKLRSYWAARKLGSLLVYLALSSAILCLTSCKAPTRAEINATIWLNNSPLPKELCFQGEVKTVLWDYGFYRKLDSGKLEFISFCDPSASQWLSVYKDDFNRMMDEYLPDSSSGRK